MLVGFNGVRKLAVAMLCCEECRFWFFLERSPVATNDTVACYYGLENAGIVVGVVLVFGIEHDVATFVADEVFVVGRYQKVIPFAETACAAAIKQIKLSPLISLKNNAVGE